MTREDLKTEISKSLGVNAIYTNMVIEDMDKYLDSRVCENCKYSIYEHIERMNTDSYTCMNKNCELLGDTFTQHFGCNRFERKEDDNT